jgi:hypothetical protein
VTSVLPPEGVVGSPVVDEPGPRDKLLSARRVLRARLLTDHFQRLQHSVHWGPLAGEASPATRTLRHDLDCLFAERVMTLVTHKGPIAIDVDPISE